MLVVLPILVNKDVCVCVYVCVCVCVLQVIGCFVEIVVFTIMGCIVNAGSLLRYVMLILMVFVYCCDCFNNVSKKYLKALFNEVKARVRDLEQVTAVGYINTI